MVKFFSKLFDQNDREIRRLARTVEIVNSLEPGTKALSDAELARKTIEFRDRLAQGAKLDDILPHAFAVAREAGVRLLGERAFDEQLMGAMILHEGRVAEMKTGEGKTLTATLAAYLNGLEGLGVHIVTVNDYLARRDSEWMGQVHRFLGLTVGLIVNGMTPDERKISYASDVIYGTNNEFGFDYLRDNMVVEAADLVQRNLNFAIVDEVDSILIDEARTPLIISGASGKPSDLYHKFARFVQRLQEGEDKDYVVDEKAHNVSVSEQGLKKAQSFFGVSGDDWLEYHPYLDKALHARALMKLDREYIVKDGQVIIVDEFTGRLMYGRRYSDGLHEAIEAKEGLKIEDPSQTLATITLQNYFRMYKKRAGMTGTALTEEDEFRKIYGMDVVVIPTHRPMIRQDFPDIVYKGQRGKYRAIVNEIIERHKTGQPMLVGTVSVEKSETLSSMLKVQGVPHSVLNAKYHEKEAEIVAQAGRLGAVTIATNMAGRGTDILLGGNPSFMAQQELRRELGEELGEAVLRKAFEQMKTDDADILRARERYRQLVKQHRDETEREHAQVVAVGGLHIIGTERHEARRIDNQLRGRSGRQGDPGSSRFYIGLDDDLMRLFGADNVAAMVDRLGLGEDEPVESGLLTKAIETAQKRVEARNFGIREHVLRYDDVMNRQRETIYEQRRKVLRGEDLRGSVRAMIERVVDYVVDTYTPDGIHPDEWDIPGLSAHIQSEYIPAGMPEPTALVGKDRKQIATIMKAAAASAYEAREAYVGAETLRQIERAVLLRVVDLKWMDHLKSIDDLREGIGLRAYGQRDPLIEYTKEAHELFSEMIDSIEQEAVKWLFHIEVAPEVKRPAAAAPSTKGAEPRIQKKKPGRNDPCPCGSGKKYKNCCGRGE